MHEIDCTDETFDPNFTTEYELSIQLGLDGFSFCILDDIRKKYLLLKHYPFLLSNNLFLYRKVTEIIAKEEILRKPYKKKHISFATTGFTAIPQAFDKDDEQDIFSFNFDRTKDEALTSFNDNIFNTKILFAYPVKVYRLLCTDDNHPAPVHPSGFLLHEASRGTMSGNQTLIWASTRFFIILIIKEGKLSLLNSYRYTNNMDFIFYLLNVFKSEGISTKEASVRLAGDIDENSHLAGFIKNRFRSFAFLKLNKDFQYSYTFSVFPAHWFSSVINFRE